MAKFRIEEIESASDWGPSGTKIIDLDYAKPITQIQIMGTFKAATTTWADSPAANFEKIEIKDGSKVLWSATGKACQGHNMQSSEKSPHGYQHLRNAKSVGVAIDLNFGRFIGDRKYAFDPTKFKNPQLHVTYNEDVHNTSCIVNSIYVQALLFDEDAPKPIGFLALKEVEAYNPTASAEKKVDLPTDEKVRMLYVNALKSQTALATTLDTIKLVEDGGEKVPYDDKAYKLIRQINKLSPVFHEDFRIHVATSGDTYFSCIGQIIGGTTGSYDAAKASGFASHMGGSFKMRVETGSQYYTAHISGYNPQGMFMLPLCDLQDDAGWFDATKLGKWELKLTAGTAAASTDTFRVYVEQLILY